MPTAAASYERQAEEMAIHRLLERRHFHTAVAVGGGNGYLYSLISQYAAIISLIDADVKNVSTATESEAGSVHWSYKDGSIDLLVMVRFLRQFADSEAQLREVARVLSPDGLAIIEVANYEVRRRPHLPGRRHRTERQTADGTRPPSARSETEKDLVPHDPRKIIRELAHAGLKVERILSVSSLQSSSLRRIMPGRMLLAVEGLLQPTLGRRYYGPNVFLSVRKVSTVRQPVK